MAQRRMFSPNIINSDAFLDMPLSSQALYFHLGMNADDDGFVNPRKIMRMIGISEDDLKILIAKRFVISFKSGVIVIKHWKINNLIRKDWYKETLYLEEKSNLIIKENGSYTENITASLTKDDGFVNNSLTQVNKVNKVNKNRERDADASSSINYLKNIPLEDISLYMNISSATANQIKEKALSLYDYCKAKGKIYKDYKAFLRNALRRDFPIREKHELLSDLIN